MHIFILVIIFIKFFLTISIFSSDSYFKSKDEDFWSILVESGDFDKDGVINLEDFLKMMQA